MIRRASLGWVGGALLGVLAGVAEGVFQPLGEPLRIPFAVGADGLIGGLWGLVVALALSVRGPSDARRGAAVLLGIVVFPVLAAGLGLFVNRILLPGAHFLSPTSLVADAIALIVAAGLSMLLGRVLCGRVAERGPRPLTAILLAVFLLAAVALPGRGGLGIADPDRPSIVLVSIDTLRPDRLSSGGEPMPTSPEIDRLLREGIQFAEALAVSPGSAASHAGLLTARYPVSNGVWSNFSVMDGSVTTLAELLREKGYRTGGFVTNTFLGRRFRFDQGFDAYVESGVVERLEEPSRAALRRSLALVQILDRLRHRLIPGYDPSFETALAWIRESDRPVFYFVHLMDVHSPYVPPHPFGARFGATPDGNGTGPRNRFGWRPSEAAYLAEIRFADAKIGRLRRVLEELGRLDESVLVLTSDHGENLLDHEPPFSHGRTLFDSTVRILASLRWPPSVSPGVVHERVFENIDVIPTLARLLDWEPLSEWEGIAFEDAPGDRVSYMQLHRDFAVRRSTSKLILRESGLRELYLLDEDPGETSPRPLTPAGIAEAERAVSEWTDEFATELYLERARSIRPEELSPETVEKLKGLGYID